MADTIVELPGVEERAIGAVYENLRRKIGGPVFFSVVTGAGKTYGCREAAGASQYDPIFS